MASSSGAPPDTTAEERAKAAAMRTGAGDGSAAASAALAGVASVEIGVGRFKYVLIEVGRAEPATHLVRGVEGAAYHMDAARPTLTRLEAAGVSYTVPGGGRIEHDPDAKTIHIYGHSYGFPWQGEPRHDITQRLCEEAFPGYKVTWSADGY